LDPRVCRFGPITFSMSQIAHRARDRRRPGKRGSDRHHHAAALSPILKGLPHSAQRWTALGIMGRSCAGKTSEPVQS
jgi:hypothetical protein